MFHFKRFALSHERSTLKIGTDAVLLATLTQAPPAHTVLDIGCGCGVIAFCVSQQLAGKAIVPEVVGIDVDPDSIAEARENALKFTLLPRDCFRFETISLQAFADEGCTPGFDLIVSNPPFFHNDLKPREKGRLQSKHGDGQLSFGDLVHGVDKLLAADGRFALILPPAEMEAFHALTVGKWYSRKSVFIQPTAAKPVSRVVREYVRAPQEETRRSLSIRDAKLRYTTEYLELVKDYLSIRV